jgi:GTP-binding protein
MLDRAEIRVKAGDGGDGIVGFRREMYVPFGGPDGGDGGKGGNVIVVATRKVDDLRQYRRKKLYRAENGMNGKGRKKNGGNGKDMMLEVPIGTIVTEVVDGEKSLLADLMKDGDRVTVARGGKGGWGNTRYKTSVNQTPYIAQLGELGEQKTISLDMRVIADVGIIGCPNVGKSTLLAAASAAKPKVAGYPFTTMEPVLGVVEIGLESFILAEIPGLIEGAHLGKGLGHDFLRHTGRTNVLIHLVDGTAISPVDDMTRVNNELGLYDPSLALKQQIVVVNKVDLPEVRERLVEIKKELAGAGIKVHVISAVTGRGVDRLMREVMRELKTIETKEVAVPQSVKVFQPRPREPRFRVSRVGNEYVVIAPRLERIWGGAGVSPEEIQWELNYQFRRLGIDKALEKAGAKSGDRVRCGEFAWEWASDERGK